MMRATSVADAVSIKRMLPVVLAVSVIVFSGCGSSDSVVNTDNDNNDSGTGGEQSGNNNGGQTDRGDGNSGSGDSAPTPGDDLMPVPSATPVSKTYSCKSEAPNDEDIALNLELTFDPATLSFAVDGDTVLTGGFTWSEATAEWVASTSRFLTNDANLEIYAKVAVDQTPTYFRRKLTQADFSYAQTECYQGLGAGNS